MLGVNYYDSEEFGDSEKMLFIALNSFDALPDVVKIRYFNTIQETYNHLAITLSNRGNDEAGLPFLLKAEELYQLVKS